MTKSAACFRVSEQALKNLDQARGLFSRSAAVNIILENLNPSGGKSHAENED
jgi:hypothetical protein